MSYSDALSRLLRIKERVSETGGDPTDETDGTLKSGSETRGYPTDETDGTVRRGGFVGNVGGGVPHFEKRASTPEERREWSDSLCRRLCRAVARETPTGLGYWDGAWRLVEVPSNKLLDTLNEWEGRGTPASREDAIKRAAEVLEAWRDAARRWEEAGRPDLPAAEGRSRG